MADITSDAMRDEEITDEGPYDPDLHHEFFIKEEEEETELRMEEEIKSEGDIALQLKITTNETYFFLSSNYSSLNYLQYVLSRPSP